MANFRSMSTARYLNVASVLLVVASLLVSSARAYTAPASAARVPGELLVKLRAGQGARARTAILANLHEALGATAVVDVKPLQTDPDLIKLRLSSDGKVAAAIQTLSRSAFVKFAEPNYVIHALQDDRTNDPEFGRLWGLHNTGQLDDPNPAPSAAPSQAGFVGSDINILPVWREGFHGSHKTLVAVIDSGIDWNHPDLKANLYTNPREIAGDGIDNDGNGFIDDIHGWNFVDHTANSNDDNKHGSHCAGTIGGIANNSTGVVGVNWDVSLLPVKFLAADGSGTSEGAVEAVNYARLMKAQILSNSWGGGAFSQALQDAIQATADAGELFIAAAGNGDPFFSMGIDLDETPVYPGSYPADNIVVVAAVDNRDQLPRFSNYGANTVHVAAPGVRIYSSVKGGGYEYLSGTSMAAPHVSGIAALLMSANPGWDYLEVKRRLIETSTPVPGLKKKIASRGRVNVYNALHNIIPVIHEPDPSLWLDSMQTSESLHPYASSTDKTLLISVPGAKYVRLVFETVDVEKNWDKVTIQTPAGVLVDEITGKVSNYRSEYVTGDTIAIRLKADASVNGWGYKVAKVQYQP